jgi:hypothetical protein
VNGLVFGVAASLIISAFFLLWKRHRNNNSPPAEAIVASILAAAAGLFVLYLAFFVLPSFDMFWVWYVLVKLLLIFAGFWLVGGAISVIRDLTDSRKQVKE